MHHETGPTSPAVSFEPLSEAASEAHAVGGVALADRPAGEPLVPESASPVPTAALPSPPAADSERDSRRRRSTSTLGGTFASVVFHLWLLSMLATLTGRPPEPPAAPAIDSTILSGR